MLIDGRIPAVAHNDGRSLRFRFSPRDAKVWPYVITGEVPGNWRERKGAFTGGATPGGTDARGIGAAAELVDRRSSTGGGGGRASRREAREPMARGFPARLRGAHGACRIATPVPTQGSQPALDRGRRLQSAAPNDGQSSYLNEMTQGSSYLNERAKPSSPPASCCSSSPCPPFGQPITSRPRATTSIPGTLERPFASLHRAQHAARQKPGPCGCAAAPIT
jgi:hypothetical protein